MAVLGGQFAVTATATTLTTALSLAQRAYVRQVDIKNANGALNTAYVGRTSAVTNAPANAIAEIGAGQAWSGVQAQNTMHTDELFVVGTANAANILFISLVS